MASPRSDIPQGTLDLLVLKVVAPAPLHGYGIAQRLQQLSRDVVQVQQGSLYPALHRLENRGLLAAEWRPSDTGREAKFYSLTRKGRRQLAAEESGWRRLAEAIGLILANAEGEIS
jgi:PadR family transcriptional regulator PadR